MAGADMRRLRPVAATRRWAGLAAIRRWTVLLLAGAAVLAVGACGKKPEFVDPPPDAKTKTFPRIYPDPRADLRPGLRSPQGVAPSGVPSQQPVTPGATDTMPGSRAPTDPLDRSLDDVISPGGSGNLP